MAAKIYVRQSVVVQRLGYLAFTQETRVRFPATEALDLCLAKKHIFTFQNIYIYIYMSDKYHI
jgi:hypothetical protein